MLALAESNGGETIERVQVSGVSSEEAQSSPDT